MLALAWCSVKPGINAAKASARQTPKAQPESTKRATPAFAFRLTTGLLVNQVRLDKPETLIVVARNLSIEIGTIGIAVLTAEINSSAYVLAI